MYAFQSQVNIAWITQADLHSPHVETDSHKYQDDWDQGHKMNNKIMFLNFQ